MPTRETRTVLAIDLGSTWCKGAYIDPAGSILAQGRTYSRFGGGHGTSEAMLERLWQALVSAVHQANTEADSQGLLPPVAIGLSCRGGNGLWLDVNAESISVPEQPPSLGAREVAEVYRSDAWGADTAFAFSYAPTEVARTRWLRRKWPEHWARVAQVVTLHDWVIHRLSGVWATDPGSGPGYHAIPPAAADLCGLPVTAFPPMRDFTVPLGPLRVDAAQALGLPPETLIVCGCHDGVAANLGANAIAPGDACLTLGSSLVLRVVCDREVPGAFGYPVAPGRWAWVRGVHGIAAQLDAVITAIDGAPPPVSPERYQACLAAAETTPAGSRGLRLPVLPRGEEARQQENARQALADGASPGAVYRAALEGTATAIRGLAMVAREDGAVPRRYHVTGAMAANPLLLEILSAQLAAPLEIADPESGLLGAAIVADVGLGWSRDLVEATARMTRPGPVVTPAAERIEAYAEWLHGQPAVHGAAPRAADWARRDSSAGQAPVSVRELG